MRIKRTVYADNAATTALNPDVLDAMLPYYQDMYGNPGGIYKPGRTAKTAVETARETVAAALNAGRSEIFFTSGGTESNNWAIQGILSAMRRHGRSHIITSAFEHPCVLEVCRHAAASGCTLTLLDAHENGIVRPEDVEKGITKQTALVSVMHVNNELGTIQPIREIGEICKRHGIPFHTDAVQSAGKLSIDVKSSCVSLLSLSAHKFHGPKGVGALYIQSGTEIASLLHGGHQEARRRAGTENVPAIVGLAKALELSCGSMEQTQARLKQYDAHLLSRLSAIPGMQLNGDRDKRVAGLLHLSFSGIEGESLILMLDMKNICVSGGSACTAGSADPSHVLSAIGLSRKAARGSLRISLSGMNSDEDIEQLCTPIAEAVERLREINPGWR